MASTIVLYDQLGSGAATTGTWAKVSGPGPAAPGTYNGSIDFAMTSLGTSRYSYTVTAGSTTSVSYVDVVWQGDTPSRSNALCPDSYYISSGIPAPFTYTVEDDSRYVCGKHAISTASDLAPTSWVYGTYSGDLWYMFIATAKNTPYLVTIEVNGEPYGTDGIYSPAIETFLHPAIGDCTDNVSQSHQAASTGNQIVNSALTVPGDGQPHVVRFRISSVSGYEGRFNIIIRGIC